MEKKRADHNKKESEKKLKQLKENLETKDKIMEDLKTEDQDLLQNSDLFKNHLMLPAEDKFKISSKAATKNSSPMRLNADY